MSIIFDILVIDDEEVMRDSCKQILSSPEYNVVVAEDGIEGLKILKDKQFDIVLLDLKMPAMDGIEVLKKIKENNSETIVIIITGYGSVEIAVDAMKIGADDFIAKPFTPDGLRVIVRKAIEKKNLITENTFLKEQLMVRNEGEMIIGSNKTIREIYKLVRKVAPTDTTVLIFGESGTGKELIARAIHHYSLRKDKPFVAVDCGSLAQNLIESELFGHIKGSFTGAVATKYGRFELANGGTIFLDEISNVGLGIQAKLLRAIQEREIIKVGDSTPVKIDVRIIAATNKDLEERIKEGKFRDDLFYRLNVVPVFLPALRERKDDVPALVDYFIKKYCNKRKKEIVTISNEAMKMLIDYDWPGNIRELENFIERIIVLTESKVIRPNDIAYCKQGINNDAKENGFEIKTITEMEKSYIAKILDLAKWQKSKASKLLGIDRKTLYRKMKEYKIFNRGNDVE
jgi:DNA-binding NtrC family response regulator